MIYGVISAIVFSVLFGVSLFVVINKKRVTKLKSTIYTVVLVASLLLFVVVPFSFHQVNTGEVAVVRHLGEIKETKDAGVYFNFWLTDEYEYYDAKVQQVQINTPAYSKDGQTLDLEVVIQYQIQPDKVKEIATVYGGLTRLESRIETISIERIKSVLSEKTAMETIETRNVVSKDVTNRVSEAISEDYYVNINSVVLTNIDFTNEFERIVEEKVAAEQEAQKAKNEAIKKETEAEAAKKVAQLEADAALYKAEKEAEAIKVEAEAIAEKEVLEAEAKAKSLALRSVEVARMLGYQINENKDGEETIYEIVFDATHDGKDIKEYLEYITYIEAWDGKLPETLVTNEDTSLILPQK